MLALLSYNFYLFFYFLYTCVAPIPVLQLLLLSMHFKYLDLINNTAGPFTGISFKNLISYIFLTNTANGVQSQSYEDRSSLTRAQK